MLGILVVVCTPWSAIMGEMAASPYLTASFVYAPGLFVIASMPAAAFAPKPASPALLKAASRKPPTSAAYLAICSCEAPAANSGNVPAACWAAMSCAAKAPVPASVNPAPKPAPPYAPKPAISPFPKSCVLSAVIPPTVAAAARGDIKAKPAGPNAKPAIIGNKESKNPASGNPVWGLIVSVPPFFSASVCKDCTSRGDI